jgi:tripartite-type tricarboxylate transporter receptor subunit TctC
MKRLLSLAGAWLLLACASVVHAQAWPTKPVRWIVPFPPGSASDITARVLSERLSALWGQGVAVENKPGAGGTIATAEMLKATPDGYTLMSGTMGTHAIAPNLYKNLSYDPVKDIVPVTMMVDVPLVLVASLKAPGATLKEFLAAVKDSPGKFAYASPGNGTLNHLMGELFKQATKADIAHIPYKGSAFVYPDMFSGAVALMFDPILGATTQLKQGRLKAYAIASPKRSAALPEVPTMGELGYPGFDATLWLGFFAPAGTPAAVVTKISADLGATLKQPEVRAKLESLGGEIVAMPHEAFAPRYRSDYARWGKAIRDVGIKLD